MSQKHLLWLEQAERDLEVAKYCLRGGFYEWTCFCSQEAAVKAIKSVLKKANKESWRHSVTNLLDVLTTVIEVPEELYASAEILDRHYVSARYPAAHHSSPPYKVYTAEMAEEAISTAEHIIKFSKEALQKLEAGAQR